MFLCFYVKPKKKSALERFGRDSMALAAAGALPPLIGRRAELVAITWILLQSRKNNMILIGEPGVGKTGVVEGFAQLMADGSLPEEHGKTRIVEISLPSLIAGTKYRGEFEERIGAVIHEASIEPRPILFIDDIHLFGVVFGVGSWISMFRLKSKWTLGEQSARTWVGRREIMGLEWVLSDIGAVGHGEVKKGFQPL